MAGFDYDMARATLAIPDDFAVEAMIAIGKPGDPNYLPEGYRDKETPTGRKPVTDFISEGLFRFR